MLKKIIIFFCFRYIAINAEQPFLFISCRNNRIMAFNKNFFFLLLLRYFFYFFVFYKKYICNVIYVVVLLCGTFCILIYNILSRNFFLVFQIQVFFFLLQSWIMFGVYMLHFIAKKKKKKIVSFRLWLQINVHRYNLPKRKKSDCIDVHFFLSI